MRPSPRYLALLAALALQLAWRHASGLAAPTPQTLEAPPPLPALRLASLGDDTAMARFWMLRLQTFDDQAGLQLSLRSLNPNHLEAWLQAILDLDPRSEYPLFVALRLYGFLPDEAILRRMIGFIHRAYRADPDHRAIWLAFAAERAVNRLKDPSTALLFLEDIRSHPRSHPLPFWISGLHLSLLYGNNELEKGLLLAQEVSRQDGLNTAERQAIEAWILKINQKRTPYAPDIEQK
ncbi:MAG: hypothetical protein HQL56_11560 [Magnetococcales bacterium]|nr:hypothetical protein [Magnetococcales bacterium]